MLQVKGSGTWLRAPGRKRPWPVTVASRGLAVASRGLGPVASRGLGPVASHGLGPVASDGLGSVAFRGLGTVAS